MAREPYIVPYATGDASLSRPCLRPGLFFASHLSNRGTPPSLPVICMLRSLSLVFGDSLSEVGCSLRRPEGKTPNRQKLQRRPGDRQSSCLSSRFSSAAESRESANRFYVHSGGNVSIMNGTRRRVFDRTPARKYVDEILRSLPSPSGLSCLRLLQPFCGRTEWLHAGPKHSVEARSVAVYAGAVERGHRRRPGLRSQSRNPDVYLPRADSGECCSRQVGAG